MKKKAKIALITILSIVAIVLAAGLSYLGYVYFSYYRIPDGTALVIENPQSAVIAPGEPHTIATYNMGFGAYGPEFSFFMDSGVMDDGVPVSGKYGKGISRELTERNTEGALSVLSELDPDIIFIQEADMKSTRAYGVDQYAGAKKAFPDMAAVWASNFHTPYSLYPLKDPHGKTEAGLVMLSSFKADSATRMSYPVADDLSRILDLDRCFAVMRLPVEGGKELVLINSHMSAYDEGGKVREAQWALITDYLTAEYEKGNYVILGGDFNHILGDWEDGMFPSEQRTPGWLAYIRSSDIPEGFSIADASNAYDVPTCRAAEIPWEKGVNYTCIIDGFIVSDNIEWSTLNIETDFAWSDHQPVLMTFTLLP